MPNNKRKTSKTITRKDSIHPGSRKASQFVRVGLRTDKLVSANARTRRRRATKLDRPIFFIHSLPDRDPSLSDSAQALSLPTFKTLILEHYLHRNDDLIQDLQEKRRAGRPKDTKLMALEEQKRKEMSEWSTGIEVPDLTDPGTCRLIRDWIEQDLSISSAHIDCLRIVRVTPDSDTLVVVREGNAVAMGLGGAVGYNIGDKAAAEADSEEEDEMEVEA